MILQILLHIIQLFLLFHIHRILMKCLLISKEIRVQVIVQTNVFTIHKHQAKIKSMELILYFTSMMELIIIQIMF